MALVMALGIMLVLAIALTTVITFSAAGARDSHRVNAGQKAYAIAEAGVNSAISQIAPHYRYPNTTTAGDNAWVCQRRRCVPYAAAHRELDGELRRRHERSGR